MRAPLAAAFLVTMLVTRPLRPDPPLALAEMILLILFPAALALLRPLTDPRLRAREPPDDSSRIRSAW